MIRFIILLLFPHLGLLVGAQYPPGFTGYDDYYSSVDSRIDQCSTKSQFCSSLSLSGSRYTSHTTTTVGRKTSTITVTYRSTLLLPTVKKTVHSREHTTTVTEGQTTITVQQCVRHSTCGPVTFTKRNELNDACSDALFSDIIISKTKHVPTVSLTTIVYNTTTTYPYDTVFTTITKIKTAPTVTTTVPTYTVRSCETLALPSSCGTDGFQWAIFNVTSADLNGGDQLSTLDPAVYKSQTPLHNGTNLYLEDLQVNAYQKGINIFNRYYLGQNIALAHRGYIYTTQTGIYRLRIPAERSVAFMWIGDTAYSGWNKSNAAVCLGSSYCEPCNATSCDYVDIHLQSGGYYPFRLVWGGNSNSGGDLYVNFRRPDGLIYLGSYSMYGYYSEYTQSYIQYYPSYNDPASELFNPGLFQNSCDGTTAPLFQDWGSET